MQLFIDDIYTAPIYHWLMFLRYNNLSFMLKDSINKIPSKLEPTFSPKSVTAYHNINDQIISEFGFNESFLAHKETEKEIALLKLDYIINGNKLNRTLWRLKEEGIRKPDNQEINDFNKEILAVSKNINLGMIDIKKFTIHQYLTAKNG
jgi:hypothetical protein